MKVGEAKGERERAIQSICLIASDGSASELRIQELKLKMMKRVQTFVLLRPGRDRVLKRQ